MKKTNRLNLILILILILVCTLSVAFGSVRLYFKYMDSTALYIVKQIRIPRTVCALLSGVLLALSGMVFQCVFKNPMADSYILGVSSGASCAVALSYMLANVISYVSIPAFAICGSLITAFLLFTLNRKSVYQLLLSGIAVNFFLSAATTLFIHLSKHQLDSVLYWTMGSFASSSYEKAIILAFLALLMTVLCIANGNRMNIMLMDDATALSNGINIQKSKIRLLLAASLATAVVVAYFGVIGFVGLMSPHIVRNISGPEHKKLTLPTALFGACIMVSSDLLSRIVAVPSELPVGIITSVLGAPIFFIIIKRRIRW